jgi:hypothetical protein
MAVMKFDVGAQVEFDDGIVFHRRKQFRGNRHQLISFYAAVRLYVF